MEPESDDQLRLNLGDVQEPPRRQRSKRLRFRAPPETDRIARPPGERAGAEPALLQVPVVGRCGFCGTTLSISGDAAICPACGGIVTRDDNEQPPGSEGSRGPQDEVPADG